MVNVKMVNGALISYNKVYSSAFFSQHDIFTKRMLVPPFRSFEIKRPT